MFIYYQNPYIWYKMARKRKTRRKKSRRSSGKIIYTVITTDNSGEVMETKSFSSKRKAVDYKKEVAEYLGSSKYTKIKKSRLNRKSTKYLWKKQKMAYNKKGQIKTGLLVRFIGMTFIIFSLPYFVLNPQNVFTIIFLAFGNFLLAIGGAID